MAYHYHTLADEEREARLLARDQREKAERLLAQLIQFMGDEAYCAWIDTAVKDGDTWPVIEAKAKDMLATLAEDAEQRDYRDTCESVRP